jgi:hypothetical protein
MEVKDMAKGEVKEIKKLKENEVLMPDGKIIEIKPVKLKYMIDKSFLGYQVIDQVGLVEIFGFGDGYDIIKRFLSATLNDEEYVNSIIDEIDIETLENILKISKSVNKVKEDELKNALTPPKVE